MYVPSPAERLHNPPLVAAPGPRRPLDLETMFYIRNLMGLAWSADSSQLFFETNITGRYHLFRVPAKGGWPHQLTVSDERTALVGVSKDARFLLYSQDKGGDEKPNLFLTTPRGGRAGALTQTTGIGYRSIRFSPDARQLAFCAELSAPGAYGVYLMSLPESVEALLEIRPEPRLLVPADGRMWEGCTWAPDGRSLAVVHSRDSMHNGLCVVNLEGEVRELIADDGEHETNPVCFSPDGRFLLVNSNLSPTGQAAPAILNLEDGSLRWLSDSPWEAIAFDWTPDGRTIVFKLNEAGSERLFLFDVASGTSRDIGLPSGIFAAAEISPDGTLLAVNYGAADRPGDLWVIPLQGGLPWQVSWSLVGGLEAADLVRPHQVTFPSGDGTTIAGFLYLPKGARPDGSHPGIVIIRGGPTAQTQNRFSRDIQYLVSRGYVVIAPNYRGSTGFGRAFMEANRGDLGGWDLQDNIAARTFLLKTGFVDEGRIAVMGGSYGGYMCLMALTKAPELWKAGVAVVPFANWFTEYENEDETLQAFDRMMMGDPVEKREFWIDRSPYFFVDRIKAPLLMLAGANDIRCPASETEEIAEKIRQAGGVVEAKIYPDEGHGFMKRENAIDSFKRTVSFLEKHMG